MLFGQWKEGGKDNPFEAGTISNFQNKLRLSTFTRGGHSLGVELQKVPAYAVTFLNAYHLDFFHPLKIYLKKR